MRFHLCCGCCGSYVVEVDLSNGLPDFGPAQQAHLDDPNHIYLSSCRRVYNEATMGAR